ncbi:MAG: hypothetical protein GWO20_13400 [Candidatus Korarchaeota archaeon]|nr:hypothetical protein [Candidatus Korarchaeota archaeon]NIU84389.1 hypothetical protein [Candidatus Thorarchaeota archaeon]NIW14497.1 hypothetical protein [Candidatus Thorarchaeota archaeon]NIW52577.1 hypothetical protein [Candidatus Korarchaeota archaeon]
MKPFFIILARDHLHVSEKIAEMDTLGIPYIVVCGEKLNFPYTVYRKANGKWDAINYGSNFVPKEADIVVLNDVDTTIHHFDEALFPLLKGWDLVYGKVNVKRGPQINFYKIADPIRKRLHIFASGELMVLKKHVFNEILPIPPCLAEDSYILFKALELGYRAYFSQKAYVTTERTKNALEEAAYKARTTLGIYQALAYTKTSRSVRFFYWLLPVGALFLGLVGKNGRAWVKGVLTGVKSHLQKVQASQF